VVVGILTLVVILGRFAIAKFFLGAALTGADATIDLAAKLLLVGATFFITDAIQGVTVGALRGIKDTRVPLLFATISYWLVGFSASCLLGFWTTLGAIGVWFGLSIGTAVYATLVVLRFRLLASRLVRA
jgi:MATE family multidrug resistance protein